MFTALTLSVNVISYGWYTSVLKSSNKTDIGVNTENNLVDSNTNTESINYVSNIASQTEGKVVVYHDTGVNATLNQRLLESKGLRDMSTQSENSILRDNPISESAINYVDGLAAYFTQLRSQLLTGINNNTAITKVNVGSQTNETRLLPDYEDIILNNNGNLPSINLDSSMVLAHDNLVKLRLDQIKELYQSKIDANVLTDKDLEYIIDSMDSTSLNSYDQSIEFLLEMINLWNG